MLRDDVAELVDFEAPTGASGPRLPGLVYVAGENAAPRPVLFDTTSAAGGYRILALMDGTPQARYADQLPGQHALTQRAQTRLELVIAASIAFAAAETEAELAEVLVDTTAKAYAAEEAVVFLFNDEGVFGQVAGSNPFVGFQDADYLSLQGRNLRSVLTVSGIAEAEAVAPAVGRVFESSGVHCRMPLRVAWRCISSMRVWFSARDECM